MLSKKNTVDSESFMLTGSRVYHTALTGSMRLLFRVREREHAAVICQGLCLPRLRRLTSRRKRLLAQSDTDVMRDVLRLVDVDLLQNFNGSSTLAQADNLLKRVARHFGLLIRHWHDELPSRVAALRGGVRGLPPQESEGDIRQSAVLLATDRALDDQLVHRQDIELQEMDQGVLSNAAIVLGRVLDTLFQRGLFFTQPCTAQSIVVQTFSKPLMASRRALPSSNTSSSLSSTVIGSSVMPGMEMGAEDVAFRYRPVTAISSRQHCTV